MENSHWINDVALEQDQREYEQYCCSIRTLDRRPRFFDISYIHYNTLLEAVQATLQTEWNGPRKLLSYRILNQKLRMQHEVQVPRNLVHKMLQNEDPEGLELRCPSSKKKERKRLFACNSPLNVVFLENLCVYQNWIFPLGVYGCLDTYSRKILFLCVCY